MKRYIAVLTLTLALLAPAVTSAMVSPSKAEQQVRSYLAEGREEGIPKPIIKCWVLSKHRTRCNVHRRSEGWYSVENLKADVYQGGGINFERYYGH